MRVVSGGVELAANVVGDGDPPLVLVHGYVGSQIDWAGVVEPLAAHRKVITFDHRGHGDSANVGERSAYTFDALVDDLGAVIGSLAPVHLLGHSMGGVVAMRYALRHPDALRSLILMDTAGETMGGIPMEAINALAEIGRTSGMDAAADVMVGFAAALGQHLDEDGKAQARAKFAKLDVEAIAAFGAELNSYRSMLDQLAALSIPTTVLVGENDTGLRGAADKLAATIPGAELVVIADAGHSPQEDNPVAWLAAVEAHLARCAA